MAVLREVPDSLFAYVVVVSRRARQLMMGGRPMVDAFSTRKTSRIAEDELRLGLLEYELPELPPGSAELDAKRRRS